MLLKKDLKADDGENERNTSICGRPQISFCDLERSMQTFTGDDTYPILLWIQEFEDTAHIME